MDQQFVQGLHQLLQQSNVPDTKVVKAATDALQNQYYKNPACVPALFEILASSPDLAVRQLAAVELRKRLSKSGGKVWLKQALDVRAGIKARLLDIVVKEQSALVRNATSRVISEIAKRELPAGSWPELLPFLFQAAESTDARHRQISIFVFFTVLETFVDGGEASLDSYLPQIMTLFSKSLVDPESLDVRVTTVRALGKVAENLEDDAAADLAQMQAAIPQMVQVLHQCLQESNTDGARQCLDVFESIAMLEAPVLTNHVAELIEFFLANGANRELEESLRIMCFNSLIWTCQYKRSKVQALGLARPMIERLMPVVVEEESDDLEEDTPSRLALRVIDGLSTELPPSQVFPPLLEQMQTYMAHADAHHRKAALLAFGVAVEGCSEYIRPHIDQLWPAVEAGLRDGDAVVRRAACIALGCLCESLGDECAERHATLLPQLMALVNDADTQRQACTALDSLLEVMGDEISQYLPAIMERLAGLLDTAPLPVKATVTGAIGSAAHASKEGFLPYFAQTMERMQPHLLLKEEGDEMDLRGITTDTIGTFAEAVGKEAFRPYFEALMKHAYESMSLDNPRMRECAFIFFAVMARVFGDEFAQFLPHVVPKLIQSFDQAEHDAVPGARGDGIVDGEGVGVNADGQLVAAGASSSSAGAAGAAEAAVEDDGDEEFIDLDELNESFLNVNSAVAVEKEVAADSLGELFAHTRQAFLPYLAESTSRLVELLAHFYQGIRKSAATALFLYINTLNEISQPQQWQPGAQVKVPLNDDVQKLVDLVIPAVLEAWQDEDDRTTAIEICQSMAECCNKNGPAIVAKHAEEICRLAAEVLDQRSAAQMDSETAGQDEASGGGAAGGADDAAAGGAGEDNSEYESVLISAATDLVGAMANVFGADFTDALRTLLPKITKYYSPGRSATERGTAMGSIGEIVIGMKDAITPFTPELLTVLSRGLQDEEASVRSNAAFAAGVLVENTGTDLSQHFGALLTAIRPMFEPSPASAPASQRRDLDVARDNACGCLSRMILRKPDGVPLTEALPVLFSSLPLKHDMAEWAPVCGALMMLVQSNDAAAAPHVDTALRVFAHVLRDVDADEVGAQLRGRLAAFASAVNATQPDKVAAAGLTPYLV